MGPSTLRHSYPKLTQDLSNIDKERRARLELPSSSSVQNENGDVLHFTSRSRGESRCERYVDDETSQI